MCLHAPLRRQIHAYGIWHLWQPRAGGVSAGDEEKQGICLARRAHFSLPTLPPLQPHTLQWLQRQPQLHVVAATTTATATTTIISRAETITATSTAILQPWSQPHPQPQLQSSTSKATTAPSLATSATIATTDASFPLPNHLWRRIHH